MEVKLRLGLAPILLLTLSSIGQALAQQNAIRGHVLSSSGTPVVGATVYALPAQSMQNQIRTRTDQNGEFVLAGVPVGEGYVSAFDEPAGYPYNFFSFFLLKGQEPKKVVVSSTAETTGVVIRFGPKAATLSLAILDETGAPIKDSAELIFTRPDLPGSYSRSSGASLSMLVPPVPFDLAVKVNGFQKWTYSAQEQVKGKRLAPNSGEQTSVVVHLKR